MLFNPKKLETIKPRNHLVNKMKKFASKFYFHKNIAFNCQMLTLFLISEELWISLEESCVKDFVNRLNPEHAYIVPNNKLLVERDF